MIKFYLNPQKNRPYSKHPIYEPCSKAWEIRLHTLLLEAAAPVPRRLTMNITETAGKWIEKK